MTKDEMLTNLYDEYQRIKNRYDFDRLEKLLLEHSNAETGLQLGLETLAGMEAAAVISETNPEGKINGKNADSRNMQRDLFLAGFRNADPTARQIIDDLARLRVTITTTGAAIEVTKARFYSYQALARMIAGLAAALQGGEKEAI